MLLLCYTWPSRTGEPEMENLFATTLLLLHYGLLLKQTGKEAPNREPTSGFYQDLELLMSPT